MLKECPKCGCTEVKIKQRIRGIGYAYYDLETGKSNWEAVHDELVYTENKYAVCTNCGKRMMRVEELYSMGQK